MKEKENRGKEEKEVIIIIHIKEKGKEVKITEIIVEKNYIEIDTIIMIEKEIEIEREIIEEEVMMKDIEVEVEKEVEAEIIVIEMGIPKEKEVENMKEIDIEKGIQIFLINLLMVNFLIFY